MRRTFASELYNRMRDDERIYLVSIDLGYKVFDDIFQDFPDRAINTGAAEQAAIGLAVGLSYAGKIPFVYSHTPFVLCRPYEFVRNYIAHEGAVVHLIGSGRGDDYGNNGFTHHAVDAEAVLRALESVALEGKGIKTHFPQEKEEIPALLDEILVSNQPSFTSLRR